MGLVLKRDGGIGHEGFQSFTMKHMNNARPKQVSGMSQGWKQWGPNMGGWLL